MSEIATPIPWAFTDTPGLLQWSWVTEHFSARVNGTEVDAEHADRRQVRSYTWEISDLVRKQQDVPRLLVQGTTTSFDEAETLIREHVGKLYDPRLGYRRFAGPLAFTFTLSTGARVDVSEYIGTRCSVTVLMPDRSERTVSGDLDVMHYKWRLSSPEQVLEILPDHVLRITNRSEVAERATEITRNQTYSGIGRIYREDPRPGCTGRPGFTTGTVDHAGSARCPIHEVGLPDHLLH